MKTIKEVIEETTALAARLRTEQPGFSSISFEFTDFPLDEVKAYAEAHGEEVKFHPSASRFGFLTAPDHYTFIHIRSVRVKAKLVYEETAEVVIQ